MPKPPIAVYRCLCCSLLPATDASSDPIDVCWRCPPDNAPDPEQMGPHLHPDGLCPVVLVGQTLCSVDSLDEGMVF